MMRSYLNFCFVISAAALIGLSATIASAGNLGLVDNGDMELASRFSPHGTPGVDSPNGFADAWHHGGESEWSNDTTDPVTSGTHSLYLPDTLISGWSEMRSFAGDSACCGGDFFGINTGNIPDVGSAGRSLNVGWNWDWDITSGQVFSGTVRISTVVGTGLDLSDGGDPNNITEYFFFTDGSANSGGFQNFATNIPLDPAAAQFDIIFNTGDRSLANDSDPGKLDAMGTMFVDDVSVNLVPEPTSLLLLSISGLMLMGRRQRG
jgi:hypothetical protein